MVRVSDHRCELFFGVFVLYFLELSTELIHTHAQKILLKMSVASDKKEQYQCFLAIGLSKSVVSKCLENDEPYWKIEKNRITLPVLNEEGDRLYIKC